MEIEVINNIGFSHPISDISINPGTCLNRMSHFQQGVMKSNQNWVRTCLIENKYWMPQQAEAIFNKISGPRNENYPGLISMLQGFQKCIA